MAWRTLCVMAILAAAGLSEARAQVVAQRLRDDVPAVTHILPAGLARGQTIEMTVAGERLEGIDRLVGPPGMTIVKVVAVEAKLARVQVAVAPDAPLGVFACCFLAKSGLSNPKLVRIDAWPQSPEHEDNNKANEATRVSLPCGVNGVLTAADQDWFRFEVAAGQRVVFDVLAQRLGSPLLPVLTLFDSAGRELKRQATAPRDIAPDTRLIYTFRESGAYFLCLRDLTYAGADFAVYQVRMGPIAFATAMFPLGGQRGAKTQVTFSGGSLDQPLIHEVDLRGDVSWRTIRLQSPLANDALAAPALFAAGDMPEIVELEPNDESAQAAPLPWPITVNGRIDRPGDRDSFRFHLAAGGKLAVRVVAQELGSPLDAVATINDGQGKELLAMDDRQPVPREPPIVRSIETPPVDDPLGEFTAAVEGDYTLMMEDRFGRGGPEFGYRLELTPANADFELVVQPGDAVAGRTPPAKGRQGPLLATYAGTGSGSLSLDRGGAGSLVVRAFRNGYNGPIQLSVEGLPDAVRAAPATIAAGQNETTIHLAADFAAASAAQAVRVIGSSVGDANLPARRRLAMQPVVFSALPVNGGLQLYLSEVVIGVSRLGAELALQASLGAPLVPGGKAQVRVVAQRREGYAGKIELKFLNLPTGLTAPLAEIAAGESSTEIELAAGNELMPGRRRLDIEATMRVAEKKEPLVAVFSLDLEILPAAAVELAQQQLDLPLGGGAALDLIVRRNLPDSADIELALTGLPKGVTAAATTIGPNMDRFELKLTAGEGAAASPIRRIVQIKPRLKSRDQTVNLPTLRFALRVVQR